MGQGILPHEGGIFEKRKRTGIKQICSQEGERLTVRKRYTFTGSVQGVGFRWRARQAASLYDCTGWIRNERDGSVTMEIQGREPDIDRVLETLREGRFILIDGIKEEIIPEETGEYGFMSE